MEISGTLWWGLIQGLYLITAIGIVFVVISENRNPLKTTSWVLLLLFVPVLGIIIYYFFGQDNRKQRMISRKMYKKIKKRPSGAVFFEEKNQVIPGYRPLVNLLNKNNDASLLDGNEITIYTTGKEKLDALYKDIEQARFHVHIQYYIFMDDEIGTKFKKLLMKKVSEGVAVRVLYDEMGNWKVKNAFYEEMVRAGIEVSSYLKVRFPVLTSRVNYRNHRKIAVIDGKVGYIGGMNIADRYEKGPVWGGVWRDTHIRIEGRGVYGLQSAFLIDWHVASQKMINLPEYFPEMPHYPANLMQIVQGGPIGQWKNLLQATIRIIANANRYVYIQTPYFLPTEAICQALQIAALGGVDVRLMLPEHCDTKVTHLATFSYVDEMLQSGVRVYFYKEGFLHAKLLLADDYITVVGSANMDFRSFEHNFEVNAYIYNEETAQKMKKIFFHDQLSCRRITLKEWRKRPRFEKFKESFMRLFSPLL